MNQVTFVFHDEKDKCQTVTEAACQDRMIGIELEGFDLTLNIPIIF